MFDTWKNRLYRLLRRSERYTKTDMVYLASGGFWSIVGQISVSISILGLSVLLARHLTKDSYGSYKYVLSIIALLSTLSLSGLSTAVFQSAARGFDGALVEGFWMNLRWSSLMFLGAFILAAYYYYQGNALLAVGMLVGGCLAPLINSANLYTSFLAGKKDFRRQTIFVAIWGTIFPTAALIAAAILTHSALWVTVTYFAANALAALYFYGRTMRIYKPDSTLKDAEMLSYSKHLSLIGILSGIAGNIDSILVFHFVGAPALAIYTFAIGIVDQSKGPLKSLDTMMQARFVSHDSAHIKANMGRKMLPLLVAALTGIAIYVPLAPYLYKILFPAYMDAVPYSQLYALSLLVMVFWPAGSYAQAKKMVRVQYVGTIGSSLLQIIVLTAGVLGWGLWGLVVARVLSRLAGNGLFYLLTLRAAS